MVDTLQDPDSLERMIQGTGGIEVVVDGVQTFAHRQRSTIERRSTGEVGLTASDRDGRAESVVVVADRLPSLPAAGTVITVEGKDTYVLDLAPLEDGALYEIAFGEWSHQVATYRPATKLTDRHQEVDAWKPIGERVLMDIRERGGEFVSRERGLEEDSLWTAVVPPGVDIQPADGVEVVSRLAVGWPSRFRVRFVGERTRLRPTALKLETSRETFA